MTHAQDAIEQFAQPHCPECGTVMVDVDDGVLCRGCGQRVLGDVDVVPPPSFDGPSVYGG